MWRDVRNLDVWEEFKRRLSSLALEQAPRVQSSSSATTGMNPTTFRTTNGGPLRPSERTGHLVQDLPLAFNDLDSQDPLRCRNFVNDLTNELLLGECSDAVRDRVLTRLSDLIGDHARLLQQRSEYRSLSQKPRHRRPRRRTRSKQ